MTSNDSTPPPSPRVFISYAHESPEHCEQVLALGTLLRTRFAIDAHMDKWYEDTRRDWPQWATDQVDQATFVLAIASPAFRERADGRTDREDGRGVRFEGGLLRDNLTRDQAEWTKRILPVVLPGYLVDHIPRFLMPYSLSHYFVDEITPHGVAELVRVLTGQPKHPLPELGGSTTLPAGTPTPPRRTHGTDEAPTVQHINKIKNSKIGTIVMGNSYHLGKADD